jgi:hypothetical protein
MDTPLVITYDNNPTETTKFFIQTLEKQKWNYKLIGEGEKWEGWVTRMNAYNAFLNTLPDEKLVILSDARDVVCLRGPKAFTKGFQSFKKDIVISMELLCCGKFNPPPGYKCTQCELLTEYWKHHNITTLPDRKFVNNGLVAGKVKALKPYFNWIIEQKFTDDQLALGKYVNAFPENVALDINAILLHTSSFGVNAGIQSIHVQKNDSPTFAELFGRGAFFLHIPGCAMKGQAAIYEFVKRTLDAGASDERLSAPYKYKEPEWDEIF